MTRFFSFLLLASAVLAVVSCADEDSQQDPAVSTIPAPVHLTCQIINEFPHDTAAFTEGFTFHEGILYESTGAPETPSNNGTWIGAVDLKTGKVDKKIDLGRKYFGEGIVFFGDKLYQLTYTTKVGFVYDAKTFKKLREFKYGSEGWGFTHDGQHLIMSTGSSNLYYLTPDSLSFVKMLPVQDNNGYVGSLNELEYINGYIYANQWPTAIIVKIDPATGYVVGRYDLTKQAEEVKRKFNGAEEMNGIAYDSTTRKSYITGKKWPVIYEIRW